MNLTIDVKCPYCGHERTVLWNEAMDVKCPYCGHERTVLWNEAIDVNCPYCGHERTVLWNEAMDVNGPRSCEACNQIFYVKLRLKLEATIYKLEKVEQ